MKTALQEADELDTSVRRDAKGREILSPEERARREEKQRKVSAEVRAPHVYGLPSVTRTVESRGSGSTGTETR